MLRTRNTLRSRLNIHAKVHECIFCKKALNSVNCLFDHYRFYINERPHCCNLCDKVFTCYSNLEAKHLQCHAGEKPFRCNLCNLMQHLQYIPLQQAYRVRAKYNSYYINFIFFTKLNFNCLLRVNCNCL